MTHALRDAWSRSLRKLVNPLLNWPSSMNRPIKWPKKPNLGLYLYSTETSVAVSETE